MIETTEGTPVLHYIDADGFYLGAWNESPPQSAIVVEPPPNWADQVWQFPGWSESTSQAISRENEWRVIEMPKAQQNVTAIEYGEEDIPGTAQQWQKYWLALRKWTDTNPDFPDSSKRPVAPS